MQVFQLTKEEGGVPWRLEFSPDGRWLAADGQPPTLLDTTQRKRPKVLALDELRGPFTFVLRGTAVTHIAEGGVKVVRLATGESYYEEARLWALVADPCTDRCYASVPSFRRKARIYCVNAMDLTFGATFGEM